MDIKKDEDVNKKFDNIIVNKIDRNKEKKLKTRKSKVFMAVINCKKSYLLKKILTTKLF